ncbi:MAG: 16S rRNA (guanine(966)-N(2))-methyltransferase RsmD [Clostridia bacterium]|nr:16S rRNA (guanine(966)-N(2))-methyltransferase RsmD [Clostridia bacterium]
MRIIAGSKKGTQLSAPQGRNTRPTLARVKESLFGILQFDIPGAAVLDLFAGSGALGLEAVSRGASLAVFCDHDRQSLTAIRQNIEKLGFGAKCVLYAVDYQAALQRAEAAGYAFDIVFLDPPYASGLALPAMETILARGLLQKGGVIVIEHDPKDLVAYAGFATDTRKYGDVALTLLRREEDE